MSPSSRANNLHEYRFGPFLFHSQLPVPELAHSTGSGRFPVAVSLGGAPYSLPNAASYGESCQVTPTEYLLDIPSVARFYVAHGHEVRVNPSPNAPTPDVSAFLLGSVFGALCHQNALLPLHASAVESSPGCVTAFLGDSGAGKSTLAASLRNRGYAILADDICLLEPHRDGSSAMQVTPVAGWLKLWRQSLDHLGHTPDEEHRVFAADDKYRVYLPPQPSPNGSARRSLLHLVFLTRASSPSDPPRLDPLPTVETIAGMMRLTYLGYITELTRSHARVFAQCARVLDTAKGYRLTVPWDLSKMEATLDLLHATLLQPERKHLGCPISAEASPG